MFQIGWNLKWKASKWEGGVGVSRYKKSMTDIGIAQVYT